MSLACAAGWDSRGKLTTSDVEKPLQVPFVLFMSNTLVLLVLSFSIFELYVTLSDLALVREWVSSCSTVTCGAITQHILERL